MNPRDFPRGNPAAATADPTHVVEPVIGEILSAHRKLSAVQVAEVLAHQREHGLRFGESAVALGLASQDDVLQALARQYHYPYAPATTQQLHADLVVLHHPFSQQAEQFRGLRAQLGNRLAEGASTARRPLCVLSTDAGEGRSYFAANLAASFAQMGQRTLLIEADMRSPRHALLFGLKSEGTGLPGLLAGRHDGEMIHEMPGMPHLCVLPCTAVPPNPSELLERPGFAMLLAELAGKFDQIIVDTPAASLYSESLVVARRCGAAVLVGRRHHSRLAAMQALTDMLAEGSTPLLGAVLNEH